MCCAVLQKTAPPAERPSTTDHQHKCNHLIPETHANYYLKSKYTHRACRNPSTSPTKPTQAQGHVDEVRCQPCPLLCPLADLQPGRSHVSVYESHEPAYELLVTLQEAHAGCRQYHDKHKSEPDRQVPPPPHMTMHQKEILSPPQIHPSKPNPEQATACATASHGTH